MARARNIKPSFFTNDTLAEIAPLGRLLFAGMWTIADREGRLEDRPKRIKAEVLPYDDCDVDSLLNDLQKLGFILRYEVDGQRYIQILAFSKHQNPHQKEAESTIPAPDKHRTSTGQATTKTGTSRADSLNPITDSLNPITTLSGKPDGDQPEKPKKPNETEQAKEALDYLNAKTGKNYQSVDANIKPLKARIKETDLATVKAVIDRKVADWQYDEKMQEFLRPATLFNATKFASYAGDAGGNSIPAWER